MLSRNRQICLPRFGRFAQRKFCFTFSLAITTIFTCFILTKIYTSGSFNFQSHHGFNYSVEVERYAKFGYIVLTPTCNILNISAWDESILPFLSPNPKKPDCQSEKRKWTYTVGSKLIINTTDMGKTGHSLDSVSCCYLKITRMEDSPEDYDYDSDRRISFSKHCTPLAAIVTQFRVTEFIRVLCQGKYWPLKSEILYRKFHALPLPGKDSFVKSKIQYWNRKRVNKTGDSSPSPNSVDAQPPPNFVILGIDSMSRLSFQRNMPKTRKVLESIGAIEMLGYTKVGENSFPNAVAFLSGYSEEELQKLCYFTRATLQDECPYIWKRFSAANYLTAFIEDVPLLSTHNYLKTGFVKQPVDYYFRPFMLGVHGHSPAMTYTLNCIDDRTVDETLLEYIEELHQISLNQSTPLFSYNWLTNLAHEDLNIEPHFDTIYSNFLEKLDLNNTVFVLMSDHGFRFGDIRATFPGWYEDKLPNFWLYLPPSIVQRYPTWKENLRINSRRLTSPFDLYQTMSHFLDVYASALTKHPKEPKFNFLRKHGQSLFTQVPELRTCQDAGIPYTYCACVPNTLTTRILSTNVQVSSSVLKDDSNRTI